MSFKRMVMAITIMAGFAMAGSVFAGTTTYKYDVQGRVVEIDYPNGAIVKYTYDNAGNRTQVTRQAGT
jgi:YD repeat-containing protein